MIKVNIIADSLSQDKIRLTTFELEYPRYIHAEIMTHRLFSRNAQSSRAVPVNKSLEQAIISPVVWGKNQAGMSSSEELTQDIKNEVAHYWHALARYCQDFSRRMSQAGLHKQWANRPLEWFSPIKVVITATEWDNFFWLRIDPNAAQPEIVELATKMKEAMDASTPKTLVAGEWHLPYLKSVVINDEISYHLPDDGKQVDLETAKQISASACAQVSYRRLNTSVGKALEIYEKLFSGPKPHMSPTEHQATPMFFPNQNPEQSNLQNPDTWQPGITHMDRNQELWSGNLKGWVQYRQLLEIGA